MRTQLVISEKRQRPALLRFTCLAVWLVVGSATVLSLFLLVGMPIFPEATQVTVGLPLPVGLVPLLLVLIGSIGVWRQEAWGILLYGIGGLIGVAVMLLHPDAIALWAGRPVLHSLAWLMLGVVHVAYSWKLWASMAQLD